MCNDAWLVCETVSDVTRRPVRYGSDRLSVGGPISCWLHSKPNRSAGSKTAVVGWSLLLLLQCSTIPLIWCQSEWTKHRQVLVCVCVSVSGFHQLYSAWRPTFAKPPHRASSFINTVALRSCVSLYILCRRSVLSAFLLVARVSVIGRFSEPSCLTFRSQTTELLCDYVKWPCSYR